LSCFISLFSPHQLLDTLQCCIIHPYSTFLPIDNALSCRRHHRINRESANPSVACRNILANMCGLFGTPTSIVHSDSSAPHYRDILVTQLSLLTVSTPHRFAHQHSVVTQWPSMSIHQSCIRRRRHHVGVAQCVLIFIPLGLRWKQSFLVILLSMWIQTQSTYHDIFRGMHSSAHARSHSYRPCISPAYESHRISSSEQTWSDEVTRPDMTHVSESTQIIVDIFVAERVRCRENNFQVQIRIQADTERTLQNTHMHSHAHADTRHQDIRHIRCRRNSDELHNAQNRASSSRQHKRDDARIRFSDAHSLSDDTLPDRAHEMRFINQGTRILEQSNERGRYMTRRSQSQHHAHCATS